MEQHEKKGNTFSKQHSQKVYRWPAEPVMDDGTVADATVRWCGWHQNILLLFCRHTANTAMLKRKDNKVTQNKMRGGLKDDDHTELNNHKSQSSASVCPLWATVGQGSISEDPLHGTERNANEIDIRHVVGIAWKKCWKCFSSCLPVPNLLPPVHKCFSFWHRRKKKTTTEEQQSLYRYSAGEKEDQVSLSLCWK